MVGELGGVVGEGVPGTKVGMAAWILEQEKPFASDGVAGGAGAGVGASSGAVPGSGFLAGSFVGGALAFQPSTKEVVTKRG